MQTKFNRRSSVRQSRRAWGSYLLSPERRAVVAAGIVQQNGWTRKQAAGLLCVNAAYVGLVGRLREEERLKLARGELSLAQIWKDYRQTLAERRAQRRQAEREAQVQIDREEQQHEIDRVIAKYGADTLMRALDRLTAPVNSALQAAE